MADRAQGMALTRVPTEQLKLLLRCVHREEIACPITPAQLAPLGLQGDSEWLMGSLRGLDAKATRAVLVAVLAERLAAEA